MKSLLGTKNVCNNKFSKTTFSSCVTAAKAAYTRTTQSSGSSSQLAAYTSSNRLPPTSAVGPSSIGPWDSLNSEDHGAGYLVGQCLLRELGEGQEVGEDEELGEGQELGEDEELGEGQELGGAPSVLVFEAGNDLVEFDAGANIIQPFFF
jgi:hypothetical protein